jgi:hypothetical protein
VTHHNGIAQVIFIRQFEREITAMKKILVSVVCLLVIVSNSSSQNVGIGTNVPHNSALLDMQSEKQGVLPPRMTWAQIKQIGNPATGLLAFDTDSKVLRIFNGTEWVILAERKDGLNDAPGSFFTAPYDIPDFGEASIRAMALDANKNIYIGGTLSTGTLTLAGESVNNPSIFADIFFAKFDSTGKPLWVKSLGSNHGSANSDDVVSAITTDPAGNVYIGGYYSVTLDFDPGPGVQNLIGNGISLTGYYAKYDANGNWIWSRSIGGSGASGFVKSIATDGVSLFVTGDFSGTANMNPFSLTAFGGSDIFVCRYQCSDGLGGATGWAKRIGSTSNDRGRSIKLYLGNLLIGGSFQGNCNFGGMNRTSAGGFDGFFAILFTTGVTVNVYEIGGTQDDEIIDVEFNAAGEIYCCGDFSGTCDFLPGAGVSNEVATAGYDGFVVKYDNSFGRDGFARITGASTNDAIFDIALDENENVYAVAYFGNTAAVNLFALTSMGQNDMILIKYAPNLYAEWVQQAGGQYTDVAEAVIYIPGRKAVVVGASSISAPYLDFKGKKHTGQFYLSWYYE